LTSQNHMTNYFRKAKEHGVQWQLSRSCRLTCTSGRVAAQFHRHGNCTTVSKTKYIGECCGCFTAYDVKRSHSIYLERQHLPYTHLEKIASRTISMVEVCLHLNAQSRSFLLSYVSERVYFPSASLVKVLATTDDICSLVIGLNGCSYLRHVCQNNFGVFIFCKPSYFHLHFALVASGELM